MKGFQVLIIICLFLSSGCSKPNEDINCESNKFYTYLTEDEKSKTPYFTNPNFDTISFASSIGDTLAFTLQKKGSFWYLDSTYYRVPSEKCPDLFYYETLNTQYSIIRGEKALGTGIFKRNYFKSTYIAVSLSVYSFLYLDSNIGRINYAQYVGDLKVGNKTYNNVMYEYSFTSPGKDVKGYYNSTSGLIMIDDKERNIIYTLIP